MRDSRNLRPTIYPISTVHSFPRQMILFYTTYQIPLIVFQVSPSLSVSSNSSGRKGKVGITIKKSPVDSSGGERGTKFETSLLGGSSSEVRLAGD